MKNFLSVLSSTLQGGLRGGLLILALLATSTLWAYDFQSGDLYYNITSSSEPYTVEVSDAVSSITTATIPETITYNGITYSITSIGKSAFEDCSSLTSVTIPEGVTSIGSYAFYNCSSLTSVTIPEGVTSIGWYAFYGCSSLSSITLPNSVTSIGYYAFYDCSSLTSITIPESVTSIDSSTFIGCYFLKENFINNSSLDAKANNYWGAQFGNEEINGLLISDNTIIRCRSYITSVTIPNSITRIGDKAFKNCFSLSSITIPYGVISIGGSAFNNCTSLTSVTIPNSVKAIVTGAFEDCSALTSITIPEGIRIVTNGTFAGCSSLTSVTIPNSVYTIGRSAFYGCSSLTSITIPNSVSDIESRAFENCSSLASFTIHENLQIESDIFEGCSSLTAINVDSNHPYYSSVDGVLFNKDRTELKKYPMGKSRSEYTIPNSVTSIGGYAFSNCSSLNSITIPNSVTSIGNLAFSNCSSLTSITLPNSVTSIGYYAFEDCSSLTSVTIPEGVTSIGSYAFYNCSSLTSVTIPEGVTSIGVAAFYNCFSLTSVTIPNSVTSIGDFAFLYCNSLSSATIGNSVTNIGDGAFYCNLEEIYCYPTTPPVVTAKTTFWNYNATLYVPCDSKEAYEEHPVFGEFKNIKGIDDCSGGFVTTHIHDTICQGEVYEFGEYICDTTGTYTAIIGDVTTFLYLTVLPSSIDTITVEACDSYEWHGEVYTESGVYTYEEWCYQEILELTIIPSEDKEYVYGTYYQDLVCNGGIYVDPITGENHLIISLDPTSLTWSDTVKGTEVDTIHTFNITPIVCPEPLTEDMLYAIGAVPKLVAGEEVDLMGTTELIMAYYQMVDQHDIADVIGVEWVLGHDVVLDAEQTTHTMVLEVWDECDDIIPMKFTFPVSKKDSEPQDTTIYISSEDVTICEGITFVWMGMEFTEEGIYTYEEIVVEDDYIYHYIYTLHLMVLPPTLDMYEVTAYDSYEWHGEVYTESGVYTYRDPYNTCVIEELHLTIIDTPTIPTEYVTICEGETYIWMGMTYTDAGTYTYEEIVEDENYIYHIIHTLELTVIPPEIVVLPEEEAYDSYEWHGEVYTESGTYFYEDYCYQEILHLTIIPSEDNQGEVVVEPSTNSVTITWQKEDDADTYIIVIKQGDKVVCTLIFDAEGNLVSVNYLPGRESNKHGIQHAGLTSDSFQYTITGLTPSTDYTYTVTATDDSDNTISSYSGEFTTHHATSVENTNSQSPTIDCQKILYEDHIYILRDGKTYTIMGQEI